MKPKSDFFSFPNFLVFPSQKIDKNIIQQFVYFNV